MPIAEVSFACEAAAIGALKAIVAEIAAVKAKHPARTG